MVSIAWKTWNVKREKADFVSVVFEIKKAK